MTRSQDFDVAEQTSWVEEVLTVKYGILGLQRSQHDYHDIDIRRVRSCCAVLHAATRCTSPVPRFANASRLECMLTLAPASSFALRRCMQKKEQLQNLRSLPSYQLTKALGPRDPCRCAVVDIKARHVVALIGRWRLKLGRRAAGGAPPQSCATAAGSFLFRACLSLAGPPAASDAVSYSYPVHQHRLKCVEASRRPHIARHEVRSTPSTRLRHSPIVAQATG